MQNKIRLLPLWLLTKLFKFSKVRNSPGCECAVRAFVMVRRMGLSPEVLRVDARVYQLANAADYVGTVLLVGDTEPLGIAVEYFEADFAFVNELVDAQRDEELGLGIGHVGRVGEELLKETFRLVEEVRSKSEQVHGYDGVLVQGMQAVAVLVHNAAVLHTLNRSALND